MFESFMVAFNAVAPFLILLGIGFAAVRLKWTDRAFMDRLNALNFRLFFPFSLISQTPFSFFSMGWVSWLHPLKSPVR